MNYDLKVAVRDKYITSSTDDHLRDSGIWK